MKNVIIAAGVGLAGVLGYVIGGKNGEAKAERKAPAIAKARRKTRAANSKRQQKPAMTAAAGLLAVQRMTKRSRKKDNKLQKARNKR